MIPIAQMRRLRYRGDVTFDPKGRDSTIMSWETKVHLQVCGETVGICKPMPCPGIQKGQSPLPGEHRLLVFPRADGCSLSDRAGGEGLGRKR